jgi:chromosome partitioning protein
VTRSKLILLDLMWLKSVHFRPKGDFMLVLFGGEKGGTGKSTLATNMAVYLAVRGEDVILVDTDVQGSASAWAAVRAENPDLPPIHCMAKGGNITKSLLDLKQRYAHVIVDAGGKDSIELRSAATAADKLYVPIKASQFDLWAFERMNDLIVGQARAFNPDLDVLAVIQMAPTNPQVNEAESAKKMLMDFPELGLSQVIVRERKVYRDAVLEGRGVLEMSNNKATEEIATLGAEIFGALKGDVRIVARAVAAEVQP